MQIQMSRKYIFTISDGQRSNNLLIVAAGKEEKPALSPTVGEGNFKWTCLCRAFWQFLRKLKLNIVLDSALSHIGICTIETRKKKDDYSRIFIVALLALKNKNLIAQ